MPSYVITDQSTGKRLKLTGDSPPTESEIAEIFAQQQQKQQSSKLLGAARSLTEGATMGWGDEIGIGAAAIAAKISGINKPLSDIYSEMKSNYEQEQTKYEQENPVASTAAKFAGGIGTGIATGGLGLPSAGASTAARLGAYGTTGAASGAITGAGEANEGGRVSGAVQGGVVGGALGAAVPAIGMAAKKGFQTIASRAPSQAPTIVGRQVAKDLADAGLSERSAIAKLRAMGPQATIADISEQTRARAETAAQLPGAANIAAQKYVARNELAGDRVANVIEGVNKGNIDIGNFVEDVIAKTKEEATPAYKAAFDAFSRQDNPITVPPNNLLNRGPTSEKLYNLMSNPIVKRAAESVGVTLDKTKPMGLAEWDAVRKGLDDIGYGKTATNIMGRVEGDVRAARNMSAVVNSELDNLVEKAGKGTLYKDARSIYSGSAKALEAAEQGGKFWNMTAQQIDSTLKKMSKSERDSFKLAGLQKLYNEALKTTEGGSAYVRLFNNTQNKMKIRALLQDDEAFNAIEQTLKNEKQFNMTYKGTTQGSNTAKRLLGAEEAGLDVAPIVTAAQGQPVAAAVQWATRQLKKLQIPESQRKELADVLMTSGPQAEAKIREVMSKMPKDGPDRRILSNILASQIGMASGRGSNGN